MYKITNCIQSSKELKKFEMSFFTFLRFFSTSQEMSRFKRYAYILTTKYKIHMELLTTIYMEDTFCMSLNTNENLRGTFTLHKDN